MRPICPCPCYAIPLKFLTRMAARNGDTPEKTLQAHAQMMLRFRSDRHLAPASVAAQASRGRPQRRVFDAAGKRRIPGQLVRDSRTPASRDAAVNEAYDNAGITLRFYREVLGRNSVDGQGMTVDSSVHVSKGFPNAMWTGRQIVYGDGDASISGFTACLDFVAHELTHGVTQHLIPGGLGVVLVPPAKRLFPWQLYALKGQAGALNESISDVLATLVKQWHARQSVAKADWLLGQHLLAPDHGFAIRSLKDPGNRHLTCLYDDQVKHMDAYRQRGDVHDNSGIPNHAFYLAARALGGYAWETVGPIWFEAVQRLNRRARFADMAQATLEVAAAQPRPQRKLKAISNAWQAVGVLPG